MIASRLPSFIEWGSLMKYKDEESLIGHLVVLPGGVDKGIWWGSAVQFSVS